ncbi:MAG: efflux RND transporter periplasmic adaptor subunit [Proteobacteria bacterium]|nr:efflux RND transporter periplasmic adaptor subunit [Pseudomonadota bacterium]MBU1450717.1 efflux RND transporter periplasmic adaptor subunit [Pseudomonadota bacterium]MBU2468656.1 efflux RND transporter periplasmic adaptor subunit [Pseudomonadota bacterium]MBU2516095.1 efflux RND transporter periplasmic adaptor subunit [Pseudomonadota bacterium]
MAKISKPALWATATFIVLGAAVTGFLLLGNQSGSQEASASTQAAPAKKAIMVSATPLRSMTFEERLIVQGNSSAKKLAMVPSKIKGTIESIFVDEGDPVRAGQTRLFQIDALKLQKAVEVRRHELAVARCALREKQANQEVIEADLAKATLDHQRYGKLFKNKTVSADAYERQQTRLKKTQAQAKHARALVDLGNEQVRQAQAGLAIAQKNLRDAMVKAPINGVISKRFMEPGEMGDPGQPILRIEDTSLIEISASLPAQYYDRVTEGKTKMRVRVYGQDLGELPISFKSPTIDSRLRTFKVKCLLKNKDNLVAPGAMAKVEVVLRRKQGLGAPKEALQQRSGRFVIFKALDEHAAMIQVQPGMETEGWVELQAKNLALGDPVVYRGQTMLDNGAAIKIVKDAN